MTNLKRLFLILALTLPFTNAQAFDHHRHWYYDWHRHHWFFGWSAYPVPYYYPPRTVIIVPPANSN